MTGLNKITDRIIAEAQADADKVIADAKKQCADIMFEANNSAEQTRASLEAQAQKEAENIIARAKSSASMKKRNIVLETRSKAVDKAFDIAYKEIRNFPDEKYCDLLSKLLADALTEQLAGEQENRELYCDEEMNVPEKYEVIFNAEDREKYGKIILAGVEHIVIGKIGREQLSKLVISEKTAPIDGGLILKCGDVENNCSISALFSQMRGNLESEVSAILFG